jgi:glycosyltransferase involved in cell wall biosynthesis
MTELIKKIFVIPNPVSNYFFNDNNILPISAKEKLIVATGAWGDKIGSGYIKNTDTMVNALCHFLTIRPDYKAVVIGSGEDIVKKFANKWALRNEINLKITGLIPNSEVAKYVRKAHILFMPSLWESFGIAAAEALCMGCSVVGSPLESLHFLTKGGLSGTLSPDFTEDAFLGALLADAVKWERGFYSPELISSTWRSLLHRETIAKSYLQVAAQLQEKR